MTYLEAHYADGFIHSEKEMNDTSPYARGKNTFYDIYHGLPEDEHGKLTKLVLHHNCEVHTIDWTKLPEGARPIRFKHMERGFGVGGWTEEARIVRVDFGYQWTDKDGNHQVVEHING